MAPRFSIIIPAHNSEKYIHRALESIAIQTFTDYEVIVVCDSCTDSTAEVVYNYGAVPVYVHYHADGLTRNEGMKLAHGEYILFMDDDDWWLHEYVLEQIDEKLKETNPDILCFSFIFKGVGYATPVRKCNGMHWIACWNKCYRREKLGDSCFSELTDGSADVWFYWKVFSKGLTVVDWDMPMYYYNYWRDDSISEQMTEDLRGRKDLL